MTKTAIVIGATGLVGRHITSQLLTDERYDKVTVFARRSTGLAGATLDEHLVDFDQLETWRNDIQGDELYSAMGTTIKQAGSKDAQWRIDYTYQHECAGAAAANGVGTLLLVSAAGAKAGSMMFYNRMKGELDEAVQKLPFAHVGIFRPSLLTGEREQSRTGERVGELAMAAATWLPGLRRYRAIEGATVARAMIAWANTTEHPPRHILSLGELFDWADR